MTKQQIAAHALAAVGAILPALGVVVGVLMAKRAAESTGGAVELGGIALAFAEAGRRLTKFAHALDPKVDEG